MDRKVLSRKGWLGAVLSLILCLVLVFSVAGGLATGSAGADDGHRPSNSHLVGTWEP